MKRLLARRLGLVFAAFCLVATGCNVVGENGANGDRVEKNLGPPGGEVLSGDGRLKLTIPSASLDETIQITIEKVAKGKAPSGSLGSVYEIGPDGYQFKSDVTVEFKYDDMAYNIPGKLRVATVVHSTWSALLPAQLNTEAQTVSGPTRHFSQFSVIEEGISSDSSNGADTSRNMDTDTNMFEDTDTDTDTDSDEDTEGNTDTIDSLEASALTSDRVMLSWTDVPQEASPESGIAIARKKASSMWSVVGSVPIGQTQFEDTELDAQTTYYYKIYVYSSYDPDSVSEYSNEISVTTKTATVLPDAPSGLAGTSKNGWLVELGWVDNADNEDGFVIERSLDNTTYVQIAKIAADLIAFQDNKVTGNTLYYYRVRAYNNVGESSNDSTSLTTVDITPTVLGGGLSSDTTLAQENSPYLVTANLVLAPGRTLTIEPGVHIRFSPGTGMEIRGDLQAIGTVLEPIVLTAVDPATAAKSAWRGITIANSVGGKGNIQFAEISFAFAGIELQCCGGGGPADVYDSTFESNQNALRGYADWIAYTYRSKFSNNDTGLIGADRIIAYSKFSNNGYGLEETERVSVYFSTFTGHTVAALQGGRDPVMYCTITGNNEGVDATYEGFSLTYNTIANNQTGVKMGSYDGNTPSLSNNNIYNNTGNNIVNNDPTGKSAINNWWGTTSDAAIEAKIWDFSDNTDLGVIEYSPFLLSPVNIIPE